MPTTHQIAAFAVAAFVIIVIPGPSVVFVVGRALAHGRRTALASVYGNSLGLLFVLVLVAGGLGYVVQASAGVFLTMKLVGAGYLIWLGVQAFRHRTSLLSTADPALSEGVPTGRAIGQGFVVGATNPKAYLMFAAVIPQFIDRSAGHVSAQMLLLGLIAFVIGLTSDSIWALAAGQFRSWFVSSPSRASAVGATGGLSMIGLGVGLAVSGQH